MTRHLLLLSTSLPLLLSALCWPVPVRASLSLTPSTDVSLLLQRLDALEASHTALQASVGDLKASNDALKAAGARLASRVASLEGELAEVTASVTATSARAPARLGSRTVVQSQGAPSTGQTACSCSSFATPVSFASDISVGGRVNGVNVTQLQDDVLRLQATAVLKQGDQRIYGTLTMDGWTVSDWSAEQTPDGNLQLAPSSATGYLATPGVTRPNAANMTCTPVPLAEPCYSPGNGAAWDAGQSQNLTQVFDTCHVPETATVVSMLAVPSVFSDQMVFAALNAAGEQLREWDRGTFCPLTSPTFTGTGGSAVSTPYLVPRAATEMVYQHKGACFFEVTGTGRTFLVMGWC